MSAKYLLDTCAWIEFAINGPMMATFSPYFADFLLIVVPVIVQLELYKWVRRQRDEATALEWIALTDKGIVVPLDTSWALLSADMALEHRLAMADALVYATAQSRRVPVVTCDAHFAGLTDVHYFAKMAG